MHPWGIHTFEDEIACDWIEDLNDSDPVVFLAHCLDLGNAKSLNYLACVGVLCTAELIIAGCVPNNRVHPRSIQRWITENPEVDLKAFTLQAIAGLRKVLNRQPELGPQSELLVRWMDHDHLGDAWLEDKQKLLRMLEYNLTR